VSPAVLAVDAGQTGIRAALTEEERGPSDGRPTRTATAPGVLRMSGGVGPEEVGAGLLAAVAALGRLPEAPLLMGVGLSGLEAAAEEDLQRVEELLRREVAVQGLAIASDGLTSLLGALGERDGAVVAAGTGTVCVARRGARLVKVDGWGSLLGDAGSGYAIGRAGLDAALRHADGRGGSRALLRAAERRYGPAPGLSERIYSAPVPTRAIAAFAVDVAVEARASDGEACAILADAGRELANTGTAALARLFGADEPAALSYTGNVFRAGAPLMEPFARALGERRPATELVPPAGDSLAGAIRLAALGARLQPEPGILWKAR
jgi:N-acetylglucosamine kinase-like BadF-type ATPase